MHNEETLSNSLPHIPSALSEDDQYEGDQKFLQMTSYYIFLEKLC